MVEKLLTNWLSICLYAFLKVRGIVQPVLYTGWHLLSLPALGGPLPTCGLSGLSSNSPWGPNESHEILLPAQQTHCEDGQKGVLERGNF